MCHCKIKYKLLLSVSFFLEKREKESLQKYFKYCKKEWIMIQTLQDATSMELDCNEKIK